MRYPAEHKQETRERVLTEAAKQIRAHGPLGVSVADIMKRAGLTHGGFYAHFRSKDALIAAAIGKMFDGARSRWDKATGERAAAAGLGAYIDSYLSPEHRDARATGCPIAALASDLPRLTAACRSAYAAGSRGVTEQFAVKLRELGHRDADALATSVVAELVGALSLARVEPDGERSDAILAASRRALRARLGLGGRS
jgi:TetR/AcrR family transcriptional regulator, transcriptional repressor for nem operon